VRDGAACSDSVSTCQPVWHERQHGHTDMVTPGGIVVPARAITWRFSRGTGPGGQGVNTTDSRVELVVDLTALVTSSEAADRVRDKLGDSLRIVAGAERSQWRNREAALRRLAERLDATARPRRHRRPTRRTAGSERRRLEAKRLRSQVKQNRRDPYSAPMDPLRDAGET
jgi:ribosome-associated protein